MRYHLLFILPSLLCQLCHGQTNRSPEYIHPSASARNKAVERIKFEQDMYVVGVKQNVQLNSDLIVFKAQVDPDSDQVEGDYHIEYSLLNLTYIRERKILTDLISNPLSIFDLDSSSGVLKNAVSLRPYVQGYFDMLIQAKTNHEVTFCQAKLFVLHSKDLLKFVFHKKPNEVKQMMSLFKDEFEKIFDERKESKESEGNIKPSASLFLYDTQYHERKDGTLDFESSSSCFQIIMLNSNSLNNQDKSKSNNTDHVHDKAFTSDEAMKMLKSNKSMKHLFSKYAITSIDHCIPLKPTYRVSKSEMGIIIIAIFIAIMAIIFACVGTKMKNNFKRKLMSAAITSSHRHHIVSHNSPSSQVHSPTPYGVPHNAPSFVSIPDHQQRIYDWQDTNPPLDVVSFRSFPTLR